MAAEREAVIYAHRNGETEPPTVEGCYWFKGEFRNNQLSELLQLQDGTCLGIEWYIGSSPENFNGQWWGPVLPPWKQEST